MTTPLAADRAEIRRFVDALFRHAEPDGYVSLRTFEHQRGAKPVEISAVQINGEGLEPVVAQATGAANRAAKFERPTVFAPPVCTFRSATRAAETDLSNGLCLAIECDERPAEACRRLIGLLGGVTAIVASGGEWADPETGEIEPRLHAYVRLTEPTRTPEEHAQLKRANRLAAALVGSDPSAVPLVHPLRWAGSIHRKGIPKLCRISDLHQEFEIDLADAEDRLEQAARLALEHATGPETDRLRTALEIPRARASAPPPKIDPDASDPDLEALADAIPNDDEPRAEWIKVGLAFFAASEGSAAGFNAWHRWSAKSAKAHGGTVDQWERFAKSPPNRTDKGALVERARRTDPDFRLPSWGPTQHPPNSKADEIRKAAWREGYETGRSDAMEREIDPEPTGGPQEGRGKARPGTSGNGHDTHREGDDAKAEAHPIPLTPAEWMARELPPPDYLMGELFSTTARVQISADTGLGKSMLGLAISVSMRLERNFLHWTSRRAAKVLVIDGEMPSDLLQDRIRVACSWFAVPAEQIFDGLLILSRDDAPDMPPLDTEDGHQWLFRFIDKLGGVDFVVFDNCMALTVGDLREETTWRALVPLCRALSVRRVGQLWLHHVGHDKSRAYGSRIFTWQMDAEGIGEAVNDNDADVSFKLTWKKSRRRTAINRADFATVTVKLIDGVWSHELEGGDAIRGQPSKLNAAGTIAVDALTRALAATGARPPGHDMTKDVYTAVTLKQWRAYFKQIAGYGDDEKGQDAERKAFGRGKENVLSIGRAKVWGEWAWLA